MSDISEMLGGWQCDPEELNSQEALLSMYGNRCQDHRRSDWQTDAVGSHEQQNLVPWLAPAGQRRRGIIASDEPTGFNRVPIWQAGFSSRDSPFLIIGVSMMFSFSRGGYQNIFTSLMGQRSGATVLLIGGARNQEIFGSQRRFPSMFSPMETDRQNDGPIITEIPNTPNEDGVECLNSLSIQDKIGDDRTSQDKTERLNEDHGYIVTEADADDNIVKETSGIDTSNSSMISSGFTTSPFFNMSANESCNAEQITRPKCKIKDRKLLKHSVPPSKQPGAYSEDAFHENGMNGEPSKLAKTESSQKEGKRENQHNDDIPDRVKVKTQRNYDTDFNERGFAKSSKTKQRNKRKNESFIRKTTNKLAINLNLQHNSTYFEQSETENEKVKVLVTHSKHNPLSTLSNNEKVGFTADKTSDNQFETCKDIQSTTENADTNALHENTEVHDGLDTNNKYSPSQLDGVFDMMTNSTYSKQSETENEKVKVLVIHSKHNPLSTLSNNEKVGFTADKTSDNQFETCKDIQSTTENADTNALDENTEVHDGLDTNNKYSPPQLDGVFDMMTNSTVEEDKRMKENPCKQRPDTDTFQTLDNNAASPEVRRDSWRTETDSTNCDITSSSNSQCSSATGMSFKACKNCIFSYYLLLLL